MNDSKCKILWMDYHKPVYVKSDPRYDNINKKCGWWRQSIYFVECLGWECIDISFPIISVYILVEKNEVFCNNIKTFSECEAAAKQLGLSDTTATDDGQNGFDRDPPYCYFESDSLKFNYGGTNTGLCGSNNDKCLCYTQTPPSTTPGTTLPHTAPPVRQCSRTCKELQSFS